MTLSPGARFGPYEIQSVLGIGGMGEVYRARDTQLNRDVAIKILPSEFATDGERLARFKREAQVLASVAQILKRHHPLQPEITPRSIRQSACDAVSRWIARVRAAARCWGADCSDVGRLRADRVRYTPGRQESMDLTPFVPWLPPFGAAFLLGVWALILMYLERRDTHRRHRP